MAINKDLVTSLTMLEELKSTLSDLEGKVDELFMRPRMPYSQNGSVNNVLQLDVDLRPFWN
jgi:hypothetical protein